MELFIFLFLFTQKHVLIFKYEHNEVLSISEFQFYLFIYFLREIQLVELREVCLHSRYYYLELTGVEPRPSNWRGWDETMRLMLRSRFNWFFCFLVRVVLHLLYNDYDIVCFNIVFIFSSYMQRVDLCSILSAYMLGKV